MCCVVFMSFFFFKQKTAYEMRISDWSSDVCSSDLDAGIIEFDGGRLEVLDVQLPVRGLVVHQVRVVDGEFALEAAQRGTGQLHAQVDPEWRMGARQAHSGTHVVHAALRDVLGPTALQSGCYNRHGYQRLDFGRSADRRVGKECVSTCRTRGSPTPETKKTNG